MQVIRPRNWDEALAVRADIPNAMPMAGGTEVMLAMKLRDLRPDVLLDLSRIPDSTQYELRSGSVCCGPNISLTAIEERLARQLPGLSMTAAAVGSRQVRNQGTLGGSLGAAAPTGDLHPMLLAADADIELRSLRGSRWVPARRFYRGPGTTVLDADELITTVRVPVATGPQWFCKVGRRQGLVKPLCSFAIVLDAGTATDARADTDGTAGWPRIRVAAGAYGPMPCRATAAEQLLAEATGRDPAGGARPLPEPLVTEFGRLAAAAVEPVEGGGASAAYRRVALAVLAARGLRRVWDEFLARGAR